MSLGARDLGKLGTDGTFTNFHLPKNWETDFLLDLNPTDPTAAIRIQTAKLPQD